jgi:hypothetical protein
MWFYSHMYLDSWPCACWYKAKYKWIHSQVYVDIWPRAHRDKTTCMRNTRPFALRCQLHRRVLTELSLTKRYQQHTSPPSFDSVVIDDTTKFGLSVSGHRWFLGRFQFFYLAIFISPLSFDCAVSPTLLSYDPAVSSAICTTNFSAYSPMFAEIFWGVIRGPKGRCLMKKSRVL